MIREGNRFQQNLSFAAEFVDIRRRNNGQLIIINLNMILEIILLLDALAEHASLNESSALK